MNFNEPAIRAADRRGATDAYDSAVIRLDQRLSGRWLSGSRNWRHGWEVRHRMRPMLGIVSQCLSDHQVDTDQLELNFKKFALRLHAL